MTSVPTLFVADANVLIDYVDTDPAVLTLVARHLGPIHVPRRILQEVSAWSASECEALGLATVTEEIEEIAAATSAQAGLSFPDRLVMAMAIRRTWTVITNDGRLRKALTDRAVPMRWGLELMIDLMRNGNLNADNGITIARQIKELNPRMKPDVIADFTAKAKAAAEAQTRGRPGR